MKVCFYFGVFARSGGIEEFTADLAMALIEAGVDVEIVCSAGSHPVLDRLGHAGVCITRIPVYHGCRWNIPDFVLLPWALARVRKADVVIHQKPFKSWFYPRLSRKPKHVYITAYHPEDQFPDSSRARAFFTFFDGILTQSETFRNYLAETGVACPIHVVPLIPPQADPRKVSAPPVNGVFKIGMLGRLERQKNPVYALEVVAALARATPAGYSGLEFNIHGTGSLEKELREKALSYGFPVSFHGRYARESVPEILAGNHLCLITSVSEGQCIVALEVLAHGRPVFATSVGALPDILARPERGAVLPMNQPEAAADCIGQWLEQNERIDAAGIVQSYMQDFSLEKIQTHYVDLLTRIHES